jgi:hypothetical protein
MTTLIHSALETIFPHFLKKKKNSKQLKAKNGWLALLLRCFVGQLKH